MGSDGPAVKTDARQETAQATNEETAAGAPGQESPRHPKNRVCFYATRSHKSTHRLTGSPRLDSAAQMYHAMAAWAGQRHE